MSATYTYTFFKSRINAKIKGKIGILVNPRDTLNEIARQVYADVDLVSARRRTALTPNLFTRIFEYASPTDLKGYGIINVEPQTDRARLAYTLVPSEEFYRRRDPDTIAISDADFIKKILINSTQPTNDLGIMIASFDATTSGGSSAWTAVGGGTNIRADSDDYVRENASLRFDLSASAVATAGIENSSLYSFDATNYFGGNGAAFVWAYITSTTGLTNYILRLGSDSSNYYQKTATTASDGTAFKTGWNLIRFDLTTLTTVGTPVVTAFDYASIYMTKLTSKVSETDYRFDSLILKKGEKDNVLYYSKYPWQTSGGTYIANSTADSDYLNVDEDEFNLMVEKGIEIAGYEVDEDTSADKSAKKYKDMVKEYVRNHPSEAMNMISTVADFKHT